MELNNEQFRADSVRNRTSEQNHTQLTAARFERMISEVEDYAIFLLDVNGNILSWNKGAEKIKGYRADEIIGKSHQLFYPPEDRERKLPQQLLEEARKNGKAVHEGWRIRKNGDPFWGNITITAIHDDFGHVTGFLKLTKDLTEKKAADDRYETLLEQLRRSEERYHKMITEVQDYAILLLDVDGNIQNWNIGAELIKGYKANEIIGKSFKNFYTTEDIINGLPDKLLKAATENGKASNEGWRRRKDGSTFWASVVITALHDEHGALIGYSKVTRDLTERKKYEDRLLNNAVELELKNHELLNLNAELSSFAYVVSHDLKEPVRKIRIFADRQLEPDNTMEDMQAFARKIISSAERMQALMESVLLYSRISNENMEQETIDLNDVLKSVKNDLELVIQDSKAQITATRLPAIKGIRFQMHQLFLNLLSNAMKFSKPGLPPEISISARLVPFSSFPEELPLADRNYHQIIFADNGIGFEQDQAEKIFDVFKRLKQKEDLTGTGIGLSIVKKAALNHHGYVTAESVPGKGSQFHVFLPAIE
ncbi:sensor histidine kinase [Longitalea luteola]|uniref:sensor histidine kinase n=1 Tax=Longitalea luteola TaxID=2812563 RepID=UPI001A96DC24|nr:PAS domain-containing sensor histidine kinase [Longitalea luteola]